MLFSLFKTGASLLCLFYFMNAVYENSALSAIMWLILLVFAVFKMHA